MYCDWPVATHFVKNILTLKKKIQSKMNLGPINPFWKKNSKCVVKVHQYFYYQNHKFTNSGIWFFITRYFDDLWTLMNIISFFEKKVVTTKDTGQLPVHHSMGYRTKGSNPLYILPENIFSRMELSFPGRWDWTSASDSGFNGITTLFTEFISNISIWTCSLTTFATLCGRICVTFVK